MSNRMNPTAILACAITAVVTLAAMPATASSHREAPFITERPKVDGTDFYMFRSYEPGREDFVTIVANYVPLQDPYGGPNYFTMDPEARYEIHIDNDGDAEADLTFEFSFSNTLKDIALSIGGVDVSVPLMNVGAIGPAVGDTTALNVTETYRVALNDHGAGTAHSLRNAVDGSKDFAKPVDNIGLKSIPDYATYASNHVYDILIPGSATNGRLFVGQRKDPFVVNLGETFDLVNTNPLGPVDGEADDLADKNITSLIMEIPISRLTNGTEPVIGAWTTASVNRANRMITNPTYENPADFSGPHMQVSRLGNPLVNEVVIGLKDKNLFNASKPVDDGQFLTYVTNPTLPALIEILFGVTAPTCIPRDDLVAIFLTGIPGVNQPAGVVPSEMLRLNTTTAATPKGSQSNLGVIDGDLAGFPNGRRPGDDVVDIALRAVMGVILPGTCAPDGALPYTDGAIVDDSFFDNAFPYLTTPIPGSPN